MVSSLNIEAHIICWNEEKFIRHTLNHYLKFCKKIVVYDNCSTDSTQRIIRDFMYQGQPVFMEVFNTGNRIDEREYLKIKNNCWKGSKADYVIVCDADEILCSMQWEDNNIVTEGVTLPKVEGFNMFSRSFPADYTASITTQVRNGVPDEKFSKQVIFDPKKITEINYKPGYHVCNPEGVLVRNKVPLLLFHYKYLSLQYITDRHEQYARRLSKYNELRMYGSEYKKGINHLISVFNELEKNSRQIIYYES